MAVEVFDGNTGDPTTVASQIEKMRGRFGLSEVVLVGDRGMITSARIREDPAPVDGLRWITALRAPAIRRLLDQGAVQRSLLDEVDLAEVTSEDYPGERLIVCRNPLLAADRARKRQELLAATEREFEKIVAATTREARRLSGADKIAMRVGQVRNKYEGRQALRNPDHRRLVSLRPKDRADRRGSGARRVLRYSDERPGRDAWSGRDAPSLQAALGRRTRVSK